MTDDKTQDQDSDSKAQDAPGQDARATEMPVIIHSQYVKDLSFENPNAPESLRGGAKQPEMDMNLHLDSRKIEEDGAPERLYEVLITINVTAKRDGKTLFLTELVYGALVSIQDGVEEKMVHPILFIEVPQIVYPFARQMLATATQAGGYPALMLNPVNFRGMYRSRFGKDEDDQAAAS